MNKTLAAVAALISLAATGAQAAVVNAATGVQSATAFVLDASNVSGGKLLTASEWDAAEPDATKSNFLAGEPGNPAVVSLGGVASVSFDWGSPDSWNTLLVNLTNGNHETFLASSLGLTSDTYVNFTTTGAAIASLTFISNGNPAFEAANFRVTSVPEPQNVALLLAGLGLMGVVARRRSL